MRFLTLSLFTALLSAPAFAADLGTYRPGTPYSSTVAGGADVCENQCAGDAQCRGWNYVKPNPRAAGICEFLSSVSTPIASPVSISGESQSAETFSSRVTQGNTNTVRVGTQVAAPSNTTRVGQVASRRTVVRQAQPDRIVPQKTSTRRVENLSLTEQQNRYRQVQSGSQAARQQQPKRPNFRPILDGPAPHNATPQFRQPQIQQPQVQPSQVRSGQRQAARRVTGPRNQARVQGQAYAAPQFQNPRAAVPTYQGQAYQPQPQAFPPQPAPRAGVTGSSRPPIGQPIPAPQAPARPVPSTPSQRLAQFTAQTRAAQAQKAPTPSAPAAVQPAPTSQSLFGRLNDDLSAPQIPAAQAVPTQPVSQQPLEDILAGGL